MARRLTTENLARDKVCTLRVVLGTVLIFSVSFGCGSQEDSGFGPDAISEKFALSSTGQAPLPAALGEAEALKLVKTQPCEDGEGVMADWVARQLDSIEAEILFPRWDAKRRSAHKYEVLFSYTVLWKDYTIEKRAFSWIVDLQLGLVGPVRPLAPEDVTPRGAHRAETNAPEKDYGLGLD